MRHETGVIGEITARHMLAENVPGHEPLGLDGGLSGSHDVQKDHAQRMTLMKKDLGKHRIALDETIGGILKETVKGLEVIKRQINDQYGEINVIGRGESRNGLLSSTSRPDFVAVVGDRKKLVMVEVKNTKTAGAKPEGVRPDNAAFSGSARMVPTNPHDGTEKNSTQGHASLAVATARSRQALGLRQSLRTSC